jgi:exo-1,4-beta-D-glucosaminidase
MIRETPVLLRKLARPALVTGLVLAATLSLAWAQYGDQMRRPERPSQMMMGGTFERTINLNDLWFLQSSEKAKGGGEAISQPGFRIDGWYPAVVPSTVMGILVENNVYRDIFVGENLKDIPTKPFEVSWWYRREFVVPPGAGTRHVRLEFDGINYRANVWLNGKKVAGEDTIYGAFRRFFVDVTGTAKPGDKNVLAVEVFPPRKGDFTIGFVDWNPKTADNSMGLWREVRVRALGDVAVNHPFVMTKLDLETLKEARLTVTAELENLSADKITGTLEGRIGNVDFKQELTLEPRETRKAVFTPESHPELVFKDPRVWWSHDLGKPELYQLTLAFRQKAGLGRPGEFKIPADKAAGETGTEAAPPDKEKGAQEKPAAPPGGKQRPRGFMVSPFSDLRTVRFGIREVSTYFNEQGHRGFKLNGKKVLIRGGGWVDDMFLDNRRPKLEAEVLYAKQMNLNTLRLEGFWGTSEDLYNLCDAQGILLMAGWSCQWEWEDLVGKPNDDFGCIKDPEDIKLVARYWRDQVRWLRNHPSIFVWMEGSDTNPRPELEQEYINILKEDDPTRPAVISAKARTSTLTGPSGVKMAGPYDYVPPVYWYMDTENGGAFGFNTETGPGPQVPPLESIKKMIPEKDLWPINPVWYFHCARGEFFGLKRYNEAMDSRIGPAKDVGEYATKAQFLNYEGMRAMFEAFVANRPKATGIIQWMYNSSWPKLWWQLYDYYLNPNGAFFGARKACEPLHLIYNYGTREVVASNLTLEPAEKLKAVIRVLDFGLKERYAKTVELRLAADEVRKLETLPELQGLTTTYFLDLRLFQDKNVLVDANFYALSTKPETLDYSKNEWYVTPVKDYADLTALAGLKPVTLKVKDKFSQGGRLCNFTVELENPSADLAFLVELRVVRDVSEETVLPIFIDDNYITLLPGEKRRIAGFVTTEDLGGEQPVLKVRGWNVK